MRITALTSPSIDPAGPAEVSPRASFKVDEFAAAIGEATGAAVSVIEGSTADLPRDGLILMFGSDGLAHLRRHPELGPRTALIGASRTTMIHDVETFDLAAAVDDARYTDWTRDVDDDPLRGLLVRRDIAERAGAARCEHSTGSAHYAPFAHPDHATLITFLGYFLKTLDAISSAIRV